METSLVTPTCPRCGARIPPEAPSGLCPKCVLLGAATPSESGRPMRRMDPPSLEQVRAAFPALEVLELIGQGGMGFVYTARQPQLDRTVALKLLPITSGSDPAFAERFAREGRLLARLNHPNIVSVYDFGQTEGFCFLIMEFVDGVNLRQAMRSGRFSPAEALAIVPKICEALQFAHEHGVLHRDIKPENILLDARGRIKIADFGIGKLVGDRATEVTLTASGARLGTPHYMAPEQIESPSEVDHRADIYSLGVVFYELLTGELPLGRFAPPSAKADLDARVDEIVLRALAKERELRQQTAGEVKTQVEDLATSAPVIAFASAQARADSTASSAATTPSSTRDEPAPFRLREDYKPLVLLLLLAGFSLLAASAVPALLAFLPWLRWDTHPFVGAILIAGGAWAVKKTWSQRGRLLTPLGLASEVEPGAKRPNLDRLLYGTAVATLVLLSARVAMTAMLILGTVFTATTSSLRNGSWFIAVGVLAQLGLMIWILRETRQRVQPQSGGEPPPWLRRVAVWFFIYAGLASLPAILPHDPNLHIWPIQSLVALIGVALLTRSKVWRNVALVVVGLTTVQALVSFVAAVSALGAGAPPAGGTPIAVTTLACLITAVVNLAGIWVLFRRDVNAAFGMEGPTPQIPPNPPPQPPQGTSWSTSAILGAALSMLAFLTLSLAGLIVPRLIHRGTEAAEAYLNIIAVALFVAFLPAILGTILGWSALRKLRAARGAQRGLGLAFGAAMLWPMILVFPAVLESSAFVLESRLSTPTHHLAFFLTAVIAGLCFNAFLASRVSRWATRTYPPPGSRTWPAVLWLAVLCIFLFQATLILTPRWMRPTEPQSSAVPPEFLGSPQFLATAPSLPSQMEDDSIALLTQTFSLKHQDAAQLIEATTPILLGQPGRLARMGRDRTELVVNATRSELNRLSTLVTVLDFPEPIQSFPEAAGGYRDPLMLARAFLYACAIRDSASARRLVSAAQRAQLDSSSTPIEAYMDGWMRYPLKQLGLEPGVALGFVERHSVFAIYDESPASLVYLSVVGEPNPSNRPTAEDPNQGRPLWIDTAPPWLETDPSAPRALVPERIEPSSLPTPLPRE